jgi:hypothetical protein
MTFDRLKQMRADLQDARSAIAEVKLALRQRISATEVKFDPNQPRAPQGTPTGGQWTNTGGGFGQRASARKPSPPRRQKRDRPKLWGIHRVPRRELHCPFLLEPLGYSAPREPMPQKYLANPRRPFCIFLTKSRRLVLCQHPRAGRLSGRDHVRRRGRDSLIVTN